MGPTLRNPFTPTFGKVPPYLAGRDELLGTMRDAFANGPGDPNLSSILIGARGSGKTALLSSIADEALSEGWVEANVSAVPGMLEDIIQRTERAARSFLRDAAQAKITGLSVGGLFGIDVERAEPPRANWRTRMTDLLEQLNERNIGLLITVDEVVVELDEMILLASVYQHFVREDRKVALVMAGLPYHVSGLLSSKSVSFLRRCRQHHLARIGDSDVENALANTFALGGKRIGAEALRRATEAVDGYPYLLQLVGYYVWAANPEPEVSLQNAEVGIQQAKREFRTGVLEQTYRELSKGDIRFLKAMLPDEDASSLADIAERMGVKSNYASQYKRRLLQAGVIGERGGSYLGFDLPGFREFLQEE